MHSSRLYTERHAKLLGMGAATTKASLGRRDVRATREEGRSPRDRACALNSQARNIIHERAPRSSGGVIRFSFRASSSTEFTILSVVNH